MFVVPVLVEIDSYTYFGKAVENANFPENHIVMVVQMYVVKYGCITNHL
jgi:hypothetical protein